MSVAFTLLRCYTFMLKKPFTFSLSEKQLNFLLVSTSQVPFVACARSLICLDEIIPPETLRDEVSPPNVVETMILSNHVHHN